MSAGKDKGSRRTGCGGRRRRKQTDSWRQDPVLSPLTTGQAERLVRLSEEAVARRGFSMRYDGSGALVPVGKDGVQVQGGMSAGLTNLARTVAGLPRQRWRTAVAAHFDQLTSPDRPPPIPHNLDNELYLRLVCASTIDPEMAQRVPEFAPGVLAVPATYVGRAVAMHFDTASLGVTQEDSTRIGLANLRRIRDEIDTVHFGGAELTVLTGSMFTASRALVFDTVLRDSLHVENPTYGCFVVIPARDLMLVHVLRDQTMMKALQQLITIAATLFSTRPGPVSPHVYYVTDHEWHQLTDHAGEVRLHAVSQLEDAARRLGVSETAA